MATGPFKYMPEPSNGTKNFLPTANFAVRQRRVQSEAPPPAGGGEHQVTVIPAGMQSTGNVVNLTTPM